MRARRLLGRRKLPLPRPKTGCSPVLTGSQTLDGSDGAQHIPSLPNLPSSTSPRHPSAFRFEHGQYKFTTGMVKLSESISQSLNVNQAAYKVYSTHPLPSTKCDQVRKLITDSEVAQSTSLGSALSNIVRLTTHVYDLSDTINGVFFQIFRPGSTLRSLHLPWVLLRSNWRWWNLICQTHRSHPRSGLSLPFVKLSTAAYNPGFTIRSGPWQRSQNSISVAIYAHLLPSALHHGVSPTQTNRSTGDQSSVGPVQTIVDGILSSTSKVLVNADFVSHVELISAVKDAVISNLSTSVLSSFMNFHSTEIVLEDWPSGRRFVSDILLNADGRELNVDRFEQDSQATGVVVRTSQQIEKHTLSTRAQTMLGIQDLQASVDIPTNHAVASAPAAAAELVQHFDVICQNSQNTGLKGCIETTQSITRADSAVLGSLACTLYGPNESSREEIGDIVLNIGSESPDDQMVLTIPSRTLFAQVLDGTKSSVYITDVQLCFGLLPQTEHESRHVERRVYTLGEEASILSHLFWSICQGIMGRMQFASYNEAASRLAEAIMELFSVPSLGLSLEAVKFCMKSADKPPMLYTVKASRRPQEIPSLHKRDAAVDTATSNHSIEHTGNLELTPAATDSQQMSDLPQVAAKARNGNKSLEGSNKQWNMTMTVGTLQLAARVSKDNARSWVINVRSQPKCDAIALISGLETINAQIVWPAKFGNRVSDHILQLALEAIHETFNSTNKIDLACILTMLSKLADLDTIPLQAHLNVAVQNDLSSLGVSPLQPKDFILITQDSGTSMSPSELSSFRVDFPIFSVSARLEGRDPDSANVIGVRVTLYMSSRRLQSDRVNTVVEQLTHLFQNVCRMSAEVLNDRSFYDLQSMASVLLDALATNKQELISDFEVPNIRVRATSRKGLYKAVIDEAAVNNFVTLSTPHEQHAHTARHESAEQLDDETGNAGMASIDLVSENPLKATQASMADTIRPCNGTSSSFPKPKGDVRQQAEVCIDGPHTPVVLPQLFREHTMMLDVKPEHEFPGETLAILASGDDTHVRAEQSPEEQTSPAPWTNKVFIALGSNLGDRLHSIESACRELDADPAIHVIKTSPLYETDPMYVADQERFLNGACEIETSLEPFALLDRLKAIEDRLGRVKLVDKGPRSIDLDILLYGHQSVASERLTIPHHLMGEREFVLRPLANIRTAKDINFKYKHSVRRALNQLPKSFSPIYTLLPLGPPHQHLRTTDPTRPTRLMSILNVTPDSFSDGGDNQAWDLGALQDTIRSQISGGASIIDVGGQSSRPNAPDVSAEEEIARILPAIEAIKSMQEAKDVAISVDTYRAPVAEAAVQAGAHIVNDISAGSLDPDMLRTIAKLGCTYVMMHMRGNPTTMMSKDNCTYKRLGLMKTLENYFREAVFNAEAAGIRRWRMILDPGIGFSKTQAQNLQLLRQLSFLKAKFPTFPLLVGTSRKSFIGKITGVEEPKQRNWGTAATVTTAVQGGADIVRVHDVAEMASVVKMADAMYRS